jgi:hypothetical protein
MNIYQTNIYIYILYGEGRGKPFATYSAFNLWIYSSENMINGNLYDICTSLVLVSEEK